MVRIWVTPSSLSADIIYVWPLRGYLTSGYLCTSSTTWTSYKHAPSARAVMKFPSSSYWQMGLVPQELFGFTFVYGYYWTVYFRWGKLEIITG